MLNIKPANVDKFVRCVPELEAEIGEKPAKLLLQIEYWIRASSTDEINGKHWTYQSTVDIQRKAFGGWSLSTINRVIKKLQTLDLIEIGNFNKAKYDHTRWFTLNPVGIAQLKSIFLFEGDTRSTQNELRSAQNDAPSNQNEPRSTQNGATIPENPTENPTESPALSPTAAATREDAAAGQSNSSSPEKIVDEKPMPPVKVETVVKADDIQEIHPQPAKPIPPVPALPPSRVNWLAEECPEDPPDDLKALFSFKPGGLELFIATHGVDSIREMIEHVRGLPNIESLPAMVIHKLGSGAQVAWERPAKDGVSYIAGKYADFIEH